MSKQPSYKKTIAQAFFTTAAWVLNVGTGYIEWVCRHTFRLLGTLSRKWRRSYQEEKWRLQRVLSNKK